MRMPSVALLLLMSAALPAAPAAPAYAQHSRAMAQDCRGASADTPANRQKAERWVQDRLKAFLPAPEQALRMRSLELQAQQVLLAFGNIGSTCAQYLAGKLDRETADLALSGNEDEIANFLHNLGNDALVTASMGRVSDIGAIRKTLTDIGTTGRQAALMGEDELAEQSRKKLNQALVSFSQTFVERSCWEQVFDDNLPYNLQRQNDMLGTGIDVLPCARRRFSAQVSAVTFESCTVRGVGDWRVTWNMRAPGSGSDGRGSGEMKVDGDRAKGDYKVDWGGNGVEYRASGDMELTRRDNGQGVKPTYTLSGDMFIRLTKGKELVEQFERLMNRETKPKKGPFSTEAQVSDRPCRSLDG